MVIKQPALVAGEDQHTTYNFITIALVGQGKSNDNGRTIAVTANFVTRGKQRLENPFVIYIYLDLIFFFAATLAAQCERCDLPQYAGLSWLAVAKCESSLGHVNEEASALVKAGRLYIQAENKNVIGCEEHLQVCILILQ